jgi:hypothetical protein
MDAHPAIANTATNAVIPNTLIEFFILNSFTIFELSYESPFKRKGKNEERKKGR